MADLGYTLIENPGIWSIIPPIVAIVLALITKEVVFSLILGILSGTIIYVAVSALPMGVVEVFNLTASLMFTKLGENAAMIIFLSLLGIVVTLVSRSGGSRAYGEWASKKFKNKRCCRCCYICTRRYHLHR